MCKLGLGLVPAEIALAMFDVMMEQEELIDRGERCDKCGELCLPEDLTQGLCDECLSEIAEKVVDEIVEEMFAAAATALAQAIEETIMEAIEEIERKKEEERQLEEMAEFLKAMACVDMDKSVKDSFRFPF